MTATHFPAVRVRGQQGSLRVTRVISETCLASPVNVSCGRFDVVATYRILEPVRYFSLSQLDAWL